MRKFNQKIVIFALVKDNQILVEKRPIKGFLEDQYLLPGGSINIDELENIELALKREMMEELGAIPIKYQLLTKGWVEGIFNNLLKPFVVSKWRGRLPKIGLDEDDPYPLEWVTFETMYSSPIKGSMQVIQLIKEYLDKS